jgi:hypothetical protein
MKEQAAAASELAASLARDKKFRRQVIGAATHGSRAKSRAAGHLGPLAVAGRLATDAELRAEVQQMTRDLQAAWARLQAKRDKSHPVRNTLLLAGVGLAVAAALRARGSSIPGVGNRSTPRTSESSIDVSVPVSTA